jgi:glycosyltransferase involved in cell wall biosynthesis
LKKKTILVLIDWFVPGYKAGGPIQSCANLVEALRDDFDVRVLTTDTDHLELEPYKNIAPDLWIYNVIPDVGIYYLSKSNKNLKEINRLIREVDPDFLYLNHLFSPLFVIAPLFLKWKRKFRATTIVCPRGALFAGALNIKKYKKYPLLVLYRLMGIQRMVRFHATNFLEKDAILSFFPGAEIHIADNLPKFLQLENTQVKKDPDSLKMLYIARIHPIKNLLFVIQCLKEIRSLIVLNIIGPVEDADYWEACWAEIHTLPDNVEVNYEGSIPNHLLGKVIDDHHLYVLPTKGENFGHSIFESLLAGRPVLISDQTPWRSLQEKKIGWDLPLDDKLSWIKAIEESATWSQETFNTYSKNAWNFAGSFIQNPELKNSYHTLIS